jgi:signal transduction histidine kinase
VEYERRVGEGSPPPEDAVPSLGDIERRRRRLWGLSGFFLLASSGAVALTLADVGVAEAVPDIPALRWGLLALAVAFLLYVSDQERLFRGLTQAFHAHDVETAMLESRVLDLTTLTRVGRTVNSVLTVGEVVETVLDAASELTRARNGSVMLREDDTLRMVASRGPHAAPTGVAVPVGEGLAGEAASRRHPLLVSGLLSAAERADGREARRSFGSAAVVPLLSNDDVVGVLSLERSHTDHEFTELDLHSIALFAEHAGVAISNAQRYEDEQSTATRLAEVLELRSEFVAALVHDLKNPINAILGFASLLDDRWDRLDADQRRRSLTAVDEEGRRLLQMVDEVLYSSSVDAGADLRRAPVLLAAQLEPLVQATAASSRAHEGVQRRVELVVAPGCRHATVLGDGQALRHVFGNLLDNAVKYSPPGSAIEVRLAPADGQLAVEVTDHGEGIAPDEVPYVFERFRQVPGGARRGVGLGLYIARTLVTAHGGRISVASTAGEGSTFRVELPTGAADEPAPLVDASALRP